VLASILSRRTKFTNGESRLPWLASESATCRLSTMETILINAYTSVTTSLAGLLSDGVVAWRFYVIYDRRKWALYVPAAAVIINACLCLSADMQHLAIYHEYNFYENTLLDVTLNITIAWGWFMFSVNTLLTASIAGKILYVLFRSPQ
jgi:hypothetical protein